ncbi:hypothetical protein KXD93_09220 [Mucilaginibacter sp. BJC16-A38]|uniref:hypothetical protein n=1 Tax=Mucilaginibacter phenanthrenivorans TaxID=1234842 RepID=UPI002157D3E4|nr:hypothetical protein [Mucilaginibacter phenanthrenivorans]MCR8557820.1 hypothetical protein [Mucilaginibacter phenanthrenivorans]
MKKQLLSIFVLLVFLVPISSFKAENNSHSIEIVKRPTITELGDFEYGGQLYSVYGDASTGTVTAVKFDVGGANVYSFSGSYYTTGWPFPHGTQPYLSVVGYGTSSPSSYFAYTGPILYY